MDELLEERLAVTDSVISARIGIGRALQLRVIPQFLAVVGGDDDRGRAAAPRARQVPHEAPDLFVEIGQRAVVDRRFVGNEIAERIAAELLSDRRPMIDVLAAARPASGVGKRWTNGVGRSFSVWTSMKCK